MVFSVRRFFCTFFMIFSFSLFSFAQEAAEPEEEIEEVDLSQDYLAKSSTPVNALAWTHDGKYFATSWNSSIILWNAATNTIAAIYSNFVEQNANPFVNATSIQFTTDGRYMLTVRDDNTVMIHSVDSQTDSTLISGTGSFIPDAVYAGDSRILISLDGVNLYESFRQGNEYIVEEKLDLANGVWGLSTTPSGQRILVTSESGSIFLIDTTSWEVLDEYSGYTLTRIKPKVAPDGVHFVAAQDQNTLIISSTADESDTYALYDPAGFSYIADFSSDSSKIVAGVNTGCVKIYDIATGTEEKSFKLMYGDSAKSLAFSPNDEFVIIGTEQGYIYRWILSGEPFVPDYGDYHELEYENGVTGENRFGNVLLLSLGFSGMNSNYYIGNFGLEIGYRHFINTLLYFGGDAYVAAGIPGTDFPYKYYVSDGMLNSPYLYTFALAPCFGINYYHKPYDLRAFAEIETGINVRSLYDNSFKNGHSSGPYFGFYGQALIGLQWHWTRLSGGVRYDTNLKLVPVARFGIAIPTRFFRKKSS